MFAQSWEDPDCDRAALRIAPGERVLAVTSGGDNVLDLLRDDPAAIVSIDLNPVQAWLFELKREGMRRLDRPAFLELLGIGTTVDAIRRYHMIRSALSPAARDFFDARPQWFAAGLLGQGGFERYFALLRRIIALAVGKRVMEDLFAQEFDQQAEFYRKRWDGWRWRLLMRIGCSRALLGNRLDPSWFTDAATSDFGAHFTALARHVLVELPTSGNWFLAQILLGRYLDDATPAYLRPENYELISERLDRIELVTADIVDGLRAQAAKSIDAFALSNVFEYSPATLFDTGEDEVARAARGQARIAHRNLLAPRRFSEDARFEPDPELSERLRLADRGFIYSWFEAVRVR